MKQRIVITAFLLALLLLPTELLLARSSSSHRSSSSSHFSKSSTVSSPRTHKEGRTKTTGVKRDKHGKIERSSKAKDEFKKNHPCPSTEKTSGACPGYVIDHIKPLKRGGEDSPGNMQWQTTSDAKAKDKRE